MAEKLDRRTRAEEAFRRSLGQPVLFAIIYAVVASALYYSLGVVAGHALGLTPFVYFAAGVMFLLAAMTYVEGSSLHQDRGGSTVFARYAFNELVSFVAGWAILLDYLILLAVTVFTATNYLAAFYAPIGRGGLETAVAFAILLFVAVGNVRGFGATRARRVMALVGADILLQLLLIVLGLVVFFGFDKWTGPIHLGTSPHWDDVIFALGVAAVLVTGLESASGLAGEVRVGRRGLKRLVASATLTVLIVYVGIGLVAVTALPVTHGTTPLGHRYVQDPVIGIVEAFHGHWYMSTLKYLFAATASLTLIAAANSAMLGLSRLAYLLSTNRQIPSVLGRLHPTRSTPYVLIGISTLIAAALILPHDLEFLVGIYAFGALLGLTIAHVSVIVLRFREPTRDRPYKTPFNVSVGATEVPVPAVAGALLSFLTWVSVVILHQGARYVGLGWMLFGIAGYVVYRRADGKPLLRRVVVPDTALRGERREAEYGSILVPLFGTALDDDIVQTAGRLAAEDDDEALDADKGATIEALWVFEIPMSLPLDARLPDAQIERARAALRRAKAVGEEYDGVEVAGAIVRARRTGQAIVDQAKRLGVQAIVLAAEEPSKIRGGARLGGRGGPLENFVGDVTKYVVAKAPCQVILTAPAAEPREQPAPDGAVPAPAEA